MLCILLVDFLVLDLNLESFFCFIELNLYINV